MIMPNFIDFFEELSFSKPFYHKGWPFCNRQRNKIKKYKSRIRFYNVLFNLNPSWSWVSDSKRDLVVGITVKCHSWLYGFLDLVPQMSQAPTFPAWYPPGGMCNTGKLGTLVLVCTQPHYPPSMKLNLETQHKINTEVLKNKILEEDKFLFWSLLPDIGLNKTCFEKARSIIKCHLKKKRKMDLH